MKSLLIPLTVLYFFIYANAENSKEDVKESEEELPIIQKARCLIPNGVSHTARALLLQQCLSRNYAQGNETACYEELGCFPMDRPWTSLLRPFPTPKPPSFIQMRLILFTRSGNKTGFNVPLWPKIDLSGSDFDPTRNKTVFITHGFASSANSSWLADMKDAYLKNVNANVFLVDWSNGATSANYLQVASNTRIVGAELARFIKNMTDTYGMNTTIIHLIGHSLGAQVSAYCAKRVPGIGRLTALDPAQPGFEALEPLVRLAHGDASFTEVIHTSARPFLPTLGFGMIQPVGDVDFYMNGGPLQPGCALPSIKVTAQIKSINDLAQIPVEVLAKWVACSHGRSYEYYTASLTANCTIWGRASSLLRQAISSGTLGISHSIQSTVESCNPQTCIPMNLDTPNFEARGIFNVNTERNAPFCRYDPEGDKTILGKIFGGSINKPKNVVSGLKSTISKVTPFLGRK